MEILHNQCPDFVLVIPDIDVPKGLGSAITCFLLHKGVRIGGCTFAPMPGCCGMVVSTQTWLEFASRGKGFSKYFHKLKEELAKQLGYTMLISTTIQRNKPQMVGATHAGWQQVAEFNNKRTGNQLSVMVKEI